MFRRASLFIGTSFTVAVCTIFATSNVDSIVDIPHKRYPMQRILIHMKSRSLCKMCPSASRVCSEPGGQKPVIYLSLNRIGAHVKQAMGLDARASRVKWPAQFMSHWHGISFTEYVFECHCLSYSYGQIPPYFVILDNNNNDGYNGTMSVVYPRISNCPASRTTLVATRFRVAVICPIIQVPHCIRAFFYFVWFVFINHIFSILLWIMYLL